MSQNNGVLVSRGYLSVSVKAGVKARLKAYCVATGRSMSSVVEALTDERSLEEFAARLRAGEVA